MRITEKGISPNARVSANQCVKLLNTWSFKFLKWFIVIETFNKKVILQSNKKIKNQYSICFYKLLLTIILMSSVKT